VVAATIMDNFEASIRFQASIGYVRFKAFTALTMKNAVVWNITHCDSCKNWRFGGKYLRIHQGEQIRELEKVSTN
jgi:hypothetical protein